VIDFAQRDIRPVPDGAEKRVVQILIKASVVLGACWGPNVMVGASMRRAVPVKRLFLAFRS
jgi:hypothetical protein